MSRILLVTPLFPPDIGGPATHAVFIERELVDRGHKVTRCYFGKYKHYPYIIRHITFFFVILFKGFRSDTIYALDPLGVGLPSAIVSLILRKHFVQRIAGDRAWETG